MKPIANHQQIKKWDNPFAGAPLNQAVVDQILSLPAFRNVHAASFPDDLALPDIIANDARLVGFERGEIVVRQDSYGDTLFMVLCGSVRSIGTANGEVAAFESRNDAGASSYASAVAGAKRWFGGLLSRTALRTHIEDVDHLLNEHVTREMGIDEMFAVSAALERGARPHTIFAAEDETLVLEFRWAGLRELRHWSPAFASHLDQHRRHRGLHIHLHDVPLFADLDEATVTAIAGQSTLETHGSFDWSHAYQRHLANANGIDHVLADEPVVCEQGHHLDGMILVRSGFGRLSIDYDGAEKTVGYLTAGDAFGLSDIVDGRGQETNLEYRQSLRAVGRLDVVRIPTRTVEQILLPALAPNGTFERALATRYAGSVASQSAPGYHARQSMFDFFVGRRLINATRAMAINTERCVNCDDCVRACAATHDGHARFDRYGPLRHNLLIANACMHCVDPVCMIDCTTGAIQRVSDTGAVVIDQSVCIGSGACAAACPYGNIRMIQLRNGDGAPVVDGDGKPALSASKCDFCSDQLGGPACQRACPHNAIIRIDLKNTDKLFNWLGLAA